MNPVSYFKNIEGDKERTDKNENITGLHQADGVKIYVDGKPLNGLVGQVTYYIPDQDQFMASHIFCMSHLSGGMPIREDGKIFDDRIKDFGEAFAVIGRLDIFAERLNAKLQSLLDSAEIIRAHTRRVEYIDKSSYSGDMDIFKKTNDYIHQNEFRIAVTRPVDFNNPFQFDIGSLSDIAKIIDTKKFVNLIEVSEDGTQIIRI